MGRWIKWRNNDVKMKHLGTGHVTHRGTDHMTSGLWNTVHGNHAISIDTGYIYRTANVSVVGKWEIDFFIPKIISSSITHTAAHVTIFSCNMKQGRRLGWKYGRVQIVVNQHFATKFWPGPMLNSQKLVVSGPVQPVRWLRLWYKVQ